MRRVGYNKFIDRQHGCVIYTSPCNFKSQILNNRKDNTMGFFSKILEKLGLRKGEDDEANKPATAGKPTAAPDTAKQPAPSGAARAASKPVGAPVSGPTITKTTAQQGQAMRSVPVAMSEVDVVEKLETMGKGSGLNWKTSIVDLLKLLDIDSSREARNELAEELGVPAELKNDSAKMNVWLHKAVLKKIAENGGNIPQSMLD